MYENNLFLYNNNNDEMAKTIFSNKQQKYNALAQTKTTLSLIQINAIITQNFKNKILILSFVY
jgi:hypothetical protein